MPLSRFLQPLLTGLLLVGLSLPACAAHDLGQLMADLARNKGGKARFVEKKFLAVLDKPLIATGEMTYTAPDRLEKRTLTPKPLPRRRNNSGRGSDAKISWSRSLPLKRVSLPFARRSRRA